MAIGARPCYKCLKWMLRELFSLFARCNTSWLSADDLFVSFL
jgi:hypothetical protein